jgi:hypothetical protein
MIENNYNINKVLWYLAIGIFIVFIILIIMEINEYYFSSKELKNTNTIQQLSNTVDDNKETYNNVDISSITNSKYSGILDYLEQVEDPKLYSNTLGCYDNDQMIEDIKGTGETCKSFAPKVINIYNKEKANNTNAENEDYFLADDGKVYSFAEICPVTSNQSRPIKCLYDEANKFQEFSIKLGNIIDDTQDTHDNKLHHIDSNLSYHIVDNNRLYNKEHVKDFIGYENYLGMDKDIYRNINDKINDLDLYSKKVKRILN